MEEEVLPGGGGPGQGWLLCAHPAVALLPYTKHEFGHSTVTRGSQPLNSLAVAFTLFRLLEFGCHHHSGVNNVPWMSRDRQEPFW